MKTVEKRSNKSIETFQWKDQHGEYHLVSQMNTHHLFFTIRMIWNHCAPEEHRIEPFKRYRFGEFYSNAYMSNAVFYIHRELCSRNDLKPYYLECLSHISDRYNQWLKRQIGE